jgi:integrase
LRLGSSSVYRAFQRACTRAKIEGVTPHTLRHSRATHLLQAGVPTWDVAGLLGDTVATVERVYGHHSPDYQRFVATKKEEGAC